MNKGVIWISSGGIAEWFDYVSYIYFSGVLGLVFLPDLPKSESKLVVLGILALSYVARPVGGLFFGAMADQKGRKQALLCSGGVMCLVSFFVSILPVATFGPILSGSLLILFRCLQSFSIGGQYIASFVLLAEDGGEKKGGFFSSIAVQSTAIGILLASLLFAFIDNHFSNQFVLNYGWRIPFMLSATLMLLVFFKRFSIRESLATKVMANRGKISENIGVLCKVFLYIAFIEVSYYFVMTMMPSLLGVYHGSFAKKLYFLSSINSILAILLIPVFGYFSDFLDNKKLYIFSSIFLVLCLALFILGTNLPISIILLDDFLLVVFLSSIASLVAIQICSQFKKYGRGMCIGFGYNLATTFFGGSTPIVVILLSKYSQGYLLGYISIVAFISCFACSKFTNRFLMRG